MPSRHSTRSSARSSDDLHDRRGAGVHGHAPAGPDTDPAHASAPSYGHAPSDEGFEHGAFADELDREPDPFFDDLGPEADDDSRHAELTELAEAATENTVENTTDTADTVREPVRGPVARTSETAPPGHGVVDRRLGLDRRTMDGKKTDLARRRGPGRRLSDFTRSAEEGEMTPEQFLFLKAIEGFKQANNKFYPSWTDVLEVIRLLGYRKTMPSELDLADVEDWRELANTPSAVRPIRPEDRAEEPKKGKGRKKAA